MREVRIDRNMGPMTYSQARKELQERREARDSYEVELPLTGRESSEQECLGCGRVVRASRWFVHSQECILLEAVVELALAARLDIQQLGEMSDE